MTQHINPGTDTTINPVVIDDSYRERKRKEQPRVDWVEEVRLRCYSYTVFYGGERVIRFDELEGVIQQVKEERKECYDAHTGAPLHPPTAQKPRQPCEECIYQAKAVEARQRVDAEIKELQKLSKAKWDAAERTKNITFSYEGIGVDEAIALLQAGDHHE